MEFIKAFEEIDKDESGEITRSELEEYMKAKNYKPAFVEKWLRIFDADNSGTITLEEFCSTLGLIPGKKQKERIQRRNTMKNLEIQIKVEDNDDENKKNKDEEDKKKMANDKDKENENLNQKKDEDVIINLSKTINVATDVNDDKTKSKKDNNNKIETSEKFILQLRNDKNDGETGSAESESSNRVSIRHQIKNTKEISFNEVYVIAEDPDISKHLRNFVLKLCLDSARKFYDELEMAKNVKMVLDTSFNKCWHVVAGRDYYGCLVTQERGMFIHVRAREWGILMWQVRKF